MNEPPISYLLDYDSLDENIETNEGVKIYFGIYRIHPAEIAKNIPRPESPPLPMNIKFSPNDNNNICISNASSFDSNFNYIDELSMIKDINRSFTPPPITINHINQLI